MSYAYKNVIKLVLDANSEQIDRITNQEICVEIMTMISDTKQSYVFDDSSNVDFLHIFTI